MVWTIPIRAADLLHHDSPLSIIHVLRNVGYRGKTVVTSHHGSEVSQLKAAGVDLVLEPFQDAADQAVDLLMGNRAPERVRFEALQDEIQDS